MDQPFRFSGLLKLTAWLQGIYYALTGIWPLVHIESFMWVTGPKYDIWLVKTVGALILVVAAVIISAGINKRISYEIMLLAIGSALGLMVIDMYYALIDRISDIYLLDALAEIVLIILWLFAWRSGKINKATHN